MTFRNFRGFCGLLIIGVAAGAAAGATTACAGPEAGSIIFSEGSSPGAGDPDNGDGKKTTTGATLPAGGGDAGPGGAAAGAPPFGNTAFAAGTPENGPAKGKTTHTMNTAKDPSGTECMACHAATFAFAGTVYSTKEGTAPVAGAEVRVTGPDGKVHASAYSDADGNFWIAALAAGTAIPAQSRVGVRNGAKSKVMQGTVAGAEGTKCNNAAGCHGSTTQRIFLD